MFSNTAIIRFRQRADARWFMTIPLLLCCGLVTAAPARSAIDPKAELAEADRLAWLKNWTKAEPHFAQAERAFEATGDRRNALYARVGRLRGEMRFSSPQLASHEVAVIMDDPLVDRDPELRLRCLTVKGDADLDIDANLAKRDWTEALAVAKELKNADWESRAKGELGIIAFLQGDSQAAILQVGLALRHAVEAHDLGAEIRYRTLVGSGLSELGQGDSALKQFDKAIALAQANKDLSTPVLPLTGKATALVKLNRAAGARDLLNQALAIAKADGNGGFQAELLTQLGVLDAKSGSRDKAISELEKAAALATAANGHRLLADVDYELAKLYESKGDVVRTERVLVSGIAASRRAGDRYFLPRYLGEYAAFNAKQGRNARAEALFEEAADTLNGILVRTSGPNAEARLVSAMNDLYLDYFRFEAQRARPAAAFAVLEQIRGRSTADLLRRPAVNATSAKLTTQEQSLSSLQLQLWKQQSRAERKKLLEKIFDAEQDLGTAQAGQQKLAHALAVLPMSATAVRARLKPEEILIEYLIGKEDAYAVVLTSTAVQVRRLPSAADIESVVSSHLAAISKQTDDSGAGRKAHSLLIEPLNDSLAGKKRLIFSPDGSLHLLPFETLVDGSGRRILDTHTVEYIPSGNVLALLRRKSAQASALAPLLAVSSSPASAKPTVLVSSASGPASGNKRGVFDADELKLKPLPAANDEIRTVANAIGAGGVVLTDATESQFKSQDLGSFRVIHLALHGLVSTNMPDRSALLFRPDPSSNEDGFLQAREIARLRLRAALVTLSACETGTGKINGQEGVENLVRPFLLAGAKSVVANLWDVDDEFSRGLMKRFYSGLAAGRDTDVALQQAKREMIRDFGAQASARLWSGFVLIGDGSAPVFGKENGRG